jgi:acetyltransferase-like isoleucine patch superfamily enzyme
MIMAYLSITRSFTHLGQRKDLVAGQQAAGNAAHRSAVRILQRYFVPRWFSSLYYFARYRCLIARDARVQFSNQISFGKGTVVKPFAVIQTQGGRISIGRECAVSSFNHISTGTAEVKIGDFVRLGPNVTILGATRDFKASSRRVMEQGHIHGNVTIGDDVFIGAGAVILPACRIGNGAVIGANSVVNKDIPGKAIVAGAPAKRIGIRE